MTQKERWTFRYEEVKNFILENKRNPSKYAEGEKFCQNCGASLTLFDKADQDMGKTNHSFWDDITDDETENTFFASKEPEQERASILEDSREESFESTGGNGFLDDFFAVELNIKDHTVNICGCPLTVDGRVLTTQFTANGEVH